MMERWRLRAPSAGLCRPLHPCPPSRSGAAWRTSPPTLSRRAGAAGTATLLGLACLTGACLAGPGQAAQIQVYPTRYDLTTDDPRGMMTIINRAPEDTLFQLSVQAWTQDGEREVLTPTRDVLANPGLFMIKGGQQQLARFGLRVPAAPVERSYRIILQEVPKARAGGSSGLITLLRVSVPIFVPPTEPVRKAMEWRLRATKSGVELVASNKGNVHVQIITVELTPSGHAGASVLADKKLSTYVLPGMQRAIPIETKTPVAAGATYQLQAETDQGSLSATVRIEAPVDAPTSR